MAPPRFKILTKALLSNVVYVSQAYDYDDDGGR